MTIPARVPAVVRSICLLALWLAPFASVPARSIVGSDGYDTTYVLDLSKRPTLRMFLVNKFNGFRSRAGGDEAIIFRPNGNINIGMGVSYRRLTFNIAFPAPFINDDVASKGKSRWLDAQANLFGERRVTNLFLQTCRGYHMPDRRPSSFDWPALTEYAYRADVRQFNMGFSTLRIVDHNRFSYRAAFNQDAWQKRSAGTWLYGGYATAYVLHADSAIVPIQLRGSGSAEAAFEDGTFIDAGVMAGRAHTWVAERHWFASVSGAVGAGPSYRTLNGAVEGHPSRIRKLGAGFHTQWRASAGHAGPRHYVGVLYSQEYVGHGWRVADRFTFDVGNVRLVYAYHLRERALRMDRGLRWLKKKTPVGGEFLPDAP